ncbi:MAG: DNRLRE domain-containing protein [Bauldia sp.]
MATVSALALMAATAQAQTTTLTFEQGVDGYTGTADTFFQTGNPAATNGEAEEWEWDGEDADGRNYGLLRFNGLFGTAANQVPPNATIVRAELVLGVTDGGDAAEIATLHNLLRPFSEFMNLSTFTTNPEPTADADFEAATVAEIPGPEEGDVLTVDVTTSVDRWFRGELPNYGWIVAPGGTGGVGIASSNVSTSVAPTLTVQTAAGEFVFRNGINGYQGTVDTWLNTGDDAEEVKGGEEHFEWDGEDAGGQNFGLLRFDEIIGTGPNQIPPGTAIQSATITIQLIDSGDIGNLHELHAGTEGQPTAFDNETTTMRNFGNGQTVRAGIDYAETPVAANVPGDTGIQTIDVTPSLQRYAAGEPNLGWVFVYTGTGGVEVVAAEAAGTVAAPPPRLVIEYTLP